MAPRPGTLARVTLAAALAALALAPALAIPTSEAGNYPPAAQMAVSPAPGSTQFSATLTLREPATNVSYQVCIVGGSCILSPRPAHALHLAASAPAAGTGAASQAAQANQSIGGGAKAGRYWSFDTAQERMPATGQPYPWAEGARLGVAWYVTTNATVHRVPAGNDTVDAACAADLASCMEGSYLTFTVGHKPDQPGMAMALLRVLPRLVGFTLLAVAVVGAVALSRRARRRRGT